VEHPHYSLDLAPSDFFLFPRIKNILKGEHFDDTDEIKSNMAIALNGILESDFQACFQSWKARMQRCVHAVGDYFEGDHIQLQQIWKINF
jgi:histone-lysine N-methyltransferase SETMAR